LVGNAYVFPLFLQGWSIVLCSDVFVTFMTKDYFIEQMHFGFGELTFYAVLVRSTLGRTLRRLAMLTEFDGKAVNLLAEFSRFHSFRELVESCLRKLGTCV
jgi:hypothetical protein